MLNIHRYKDEADGKKKIEITTHTKDFNLTIIYEFEFKVKEIKNLR